MFFFQHLLIVCRSFEHFETVSRTVGLTERTRDGERALVREVETDRERVKVSERAVLFISGAKLRRLLTVVPHEYDGMCLLM